MSTGWLKAALGAVCAAGCVQAGAVELPDTICFTVGQGPNGRPSYLDVSINSFGPISLDAWCVDSDNGISSAPTYTGHVYRLNDPAVPLLFDYPGAVGNLDLVQYILNQSYPPEVTFGDIQRAIWILVEDNPSTGNLGVWSPERVEAILADAVANGEGFVPACGQTTFVLLNPVLVNACDLNTANTATIAQLMIVEVPVECAAIGNFVWEDLNKNGIQDANEPGVPDVVVNLLDCDGNLIDSTSTDANGEYGFLDLPPGNYTVQVVPPAGYALTLQDQGDDEFDSDADSTGLMTCTQLVGGEVDPSWDAGLVKLPEEVLCGECEGKVSQLTLRYDGPSSAQIVVATTRPDALVAFQNIVNPGESFVVNGIDRHGTLGVEILLYVNGYLKAKIHTSCSQPIGPGLVAGPFTVIEGYSKEGGLLCEYTGGQDDCPKEEPKDPKDCKDRDDRDKDCKKDWDRDDRDKDCKDDKKDKDRDDKDKDKDCKDDDKGGKSSKSYGWR